MIVLRQDLETLIAANDYRVLSGSEIEKCLRGVETL